MFASNTLLDSTAILVAMTKKSINQVFAENLAALMEKRRVNQTALSKLSKLSQKTISNYLNPAQRTDGAKGKEPSAKLTELAMIAEALEIDAWELLRPLDANERKAYEAIQVALKALRPEPTKPPTAPLAQLVAAAASPQQANVARR